MNDLKKWSYNQRNPDSRNQFDFYYLRIASNFFFQILFTNNSGIVGKKGGKKTDLSWPTGEGFKWNTFQKHINFSLRNVRYIGGNGILQKSYMLSVKRMNWPKPWRTIFILKKHMSRQGFFQKSAPRMCKKSTSAERRKDNALG